MEFQAYPAIEVSPCLPWMLLVDKLNLLKKRLDSRNGTLFEDGDRDQ